MIIKSWSIDGYGVFNGAISPTLGRGVTVVLGPNEAGKSTLLSFLRSVLFGFPERKGERGKAEFIPAARGGKLGGKIILEDDSGGRWTVERYHGAKQLSVTSPTGAKLGEAELGDLLGNLNAASYRSVFGFDLADLARLDALEDDKVSGRITSAGISGAGDTAAKALKKLDDRLSDLLGKSERGGSRLNKLGQELKEVSDRFKEARARLGAYEEMKAAHLAEESALRELAEEIDSARARAERLKTLLRLKPEADRRLRAKAELAALDAPDFFPEEGLARFTRHLERRGELEKRVGEISTALDAERAREREFATDRRWLEKAAALSQKDRESGEQRARLKEIAELGAECDLQRSTLSGALASLGVGWSEDALREAPTDLVRATLAKEYRAKIATAEGELSNSRKNLAAAKARLETLKEPPPRQATADAKGWAGYALIAGGLLAAVAASLFASLGALPLYLLCALILIAGVFAVSGKKPSAKTSEDAAFEAAHAHARAEAERCGELERLAASELHARMDEWNAASVKWSLKSNDALTPEAAIELLTRIESAKALLSLLDATRLKLARARSASAEWEDGSLALLSETPLQVSGERGQPLCDLLSEAARRGEAEREKATRERAAREAVGNLERDKALLEREAKAEGDQLAALKASVSVESDEEFRHAEAQYRRKAALLAEIASTGSVLAGQLGLNWEEGEQGAELLSGSLDGWRSELDALTATGKEMVERHTARNRAFGARGAELAELERSSAAAELEARIEAIKAEGAAAAREWRVAAAARELIIRSLDKYARERQPGVLAEGSRLFAAMTDGRFLRVLQSPDGGAILAERANGELLEVTALSRGTREELYLSVRLALAADFAGRGANLPIVADDIFVNFDPARAGAAIKALCDFAGERQALVFTCHPETVGRFRAAKPDVAVFTLAPATGALEPLST